MMIVIVMDSDGYHHRHDYHHCIRLAIVYNVFCDTFRVGFGVGRLPMITLVMVMPIAYMLFSALFWQLSIKLLPGLDNKIRGAALLCSSQKTLAFGIPFIKTAFGSRSDLAFMLAPLLLYAPAQLLLGSSLIVPGLQKLILEEQDLEGGEGI